MSTLRALLVGINEYHPDSRVSALTGCLNDVDRMTTFLNNHYPSAQIQRLVNHQATRQNIIDTFQSHLIEAAQPGDVAFFHYSGHGSYQTTAEEFRGMSDDKHQDETIVCYDSRLPGNYDLADKEIAVLLSKFKTGVDVVIFVDACHAGSITRDEDDSEEAQEIRTRQNPGRREPRPLESYLNGHYTKLSPLEIPTSRHIALMACDRDQKAKEVAFNGLFTKTFLNTIEKSGSAKLTYADIFQRIKAQIGRAYQDQTPKFHTFEGFNAYRYLLDQKDDENRQAEYHVHYNKERNFWQLNMGAVHGLGMPEEGADKPENRIAVYLYDNASNDGAAPIAAYVQTVKMSHSLLEIPALAAGNQGKTDFKAQIVSLPKPAVQFYLSGEADSMDAFVAQASKINPLLVFDNATNAKYEVKLLPTSIRIYHKQSGKELKDGYVDWTNEANPAIQSKMTQHLIEQLGKIEKWERLVAVANESDLLSKIDWWMEIQDESGNWQAIDKNQKELQLVYDGNFKIPFRIIAENNTNQNVYLSLLQFNRNFSIDKRLEEEYYFAAGTKAQQIHESKFLIADDSPESTNVFKLIVSLKGLDNYLFIQSKLAPFQSTRDTEEETPPPTNFEEWLAENLTVRVVRNNGSLQNGLHTSTLQIEGNQALEGNVTIGIANNYTRSVESVRPFDQVTDQLNRQGLELLSLNNNAPSTIEINELAPGALAAPLKMSLQTEDHSAIPITTDGEFVLPFGLVQPNAETGAVDVEIEDFPAGVDHTAPTRSLGRAVVFGFLKLGSKFGVKIDVPIFKLRMVDFSKEPVQFSKDQTTLRAAVARANSVILLIHGFLGNTRQEAEILRTYQNQADLVLAFDYENLATSIEDIADQLQTLLQEAGIGSNDGKQLTVIAHSLGGLVARYWVENKIPTEDTVDRLVLIGVPNGGTLWGKVDDWLKYLNIALGFVLNWFTGPIGNMIQWAAKMLTQAQDFSKNFEGLQTLRQMTPDSEFLKALSKNQKPIHPEYIVLVGDMTEILKQEDKKLARLWNKLTYNTGNWLAQNKSHDGFASVESQKALPFATDVIQVNASHYSYFDQEDLLKTAFQSSTLQAQEQS